MKKLYNKNNKLHKHILTIIVLLIAIFNFFYLYKIGYLNQIFIKEIPESPIIFTDQIDNYYRQTLAFANGSLSFLEDASHLEKIQNPYNLQEREYVHYLFDTSYYKGKYYSYYTILPIVFILLPIYKITHMFLNLVIVNLLILTLGTYIASKLYQRVVEDYIKEIPFTLYIIGFLTLIFGANMLMLMRGMKYDIAVSCGILFLVSTIYTLLTLKNKQRIKLKLILAGIFTAFIVLSKPTYIMYYILIAYILYQVFKRDLDNKKDILYYMVPLGMIAIFQMIYNYARYDSIFEFGAKYQLTGFNLIEYTKISPNRILRALKYYLFNIPKIDPEEFPYIFMHLKEDNALHNEFLYENVVTGLISYPVFILGFLMIFKKAKDKLTKNMKLSMIIMYIIFAILVFINATFAGVSEIYSIEFKFMLMLISIIYILRYISVNQDKKLIKYLFVIFCLLNIIIILPISYSGESLCFLNLLSS